MSAGKTSSSAQTDEGVCFERVSDTFLRLHMYVSQCECVVCQPCALSRPRDSEVLKSKMNKLYQILQIGSKRCKSGRILFIVDASSTARPPSFLVSTGAPHLVSDSADGLRRFWGWLQKARSSSQTRALYQLLCRDSLQKSVSASRFVHCTYNCYLVSNFEDEWQCLPC